MPLTHTRAAASLKNYGFTSVQAGGGGGPTDPYFDQTTLLLHGDGTNGAQNNTFLDSSTNNFTITRNGNTTQGTFSPFSQDDGKWGAYFDGSEDYLSWSGTTLAGDFTVECWVYKTATDASGYTNVFSHSSQNTQLTFDQTTSGSVGLVINASVVISPSGTAVTANAWHHIAWVREGSTCRVYVNGVQQGTGTSSTSMSLSFIGQFRNGGYEMNGYISNARIVAGTCLYPSGTTFTPSTTPLTAISGTSLLTCQSNRFKDNSANAFAITVNGNTSIQPFSPFAPSAAYSAATNGGSGYFDGSGDYLTLADNAAFDVGSGDFTVECWINHSFTGARKFILGQSNSAGQNTSIPFYLSKTSANKLNFNVCVGAVEYNAVSTIDAPLNEFVHIAGVRDGGTTRLYINGVQAATNASLSTQTINNSSNLFGIGCLGEYVSQDTWSGYISNVRLVKGTCLYPSGTTFTPSTTPLTAISGTSLLLNFTNAGILDNTGRNALETVGNAQISTSVKKFGTGSLAFDGTGDYLQMSQGFTLGAGNFTVEAWIYPTVANQKPEVWQRSGLISDFAVSTNFNAADAGIILGEFVNAGSGYSATAGSTALTQNAWNHVAWVRSGSTVTMYLNGTSVGTVSNSSDTQSLGRIGAFAAATYDFSGYIDDLRITKGVARYTSNFTPPTAAFEDQ